ncbi:MAG: transketolase [Candidatus Paceibacterota bacterium]
MENIKDETIKELKIKANDIRKSIVEMLYLAGSGHTAGALGMADIFTYLYFNALRHKPENPYWKDRDHLVLSNWHICPVLYATMAHAGYFKFEELKTLRKFGSPLQGHPHREFLPQVDTSSGPLGEGLSQAVGMAIASRMDNGVDKTIYCLVGDGELNEGQNWEAIMLGAKYKLDNLIVIVDRNFIQIDGTTEEVMPLSVLEDKWKSFNWDVQKINGNDFREINHAIYHAKNTKWKPSVIIANTIPSKGVKEWENDYKWHGVAPNKDQYEMAIKELNMLGDKLK